MDPAQILDTLWDEITIRDSPWAQLLPATIDPRRGGPVRRLAHGRVEFTGAEGAEGPWRCDTCRTLAWFMVADVCPTYQCRGTIRPVQAGADRGHYAALYKSYVLVPMTTEEHTAQWAMDKGTEIQTRFVTGDINVLSCSTTFELGVDVGEVEAVLLRNVPPSPANYVQRAGRAGRRTGAAAMVVTLAQRRNHDLAWFARPEAMVSGVVAPPRIILDNPILARRHAHSVAFAAYQRRAESRTAGDFFLPDASGGTRDADFLEWLHTHPSDLGEALVRITPDGAAALIDLAGWGWVDALVADDPRDPTFGWLRRAGDEVRGDAGRLAELIDDAAGRQEFKAAERLKWQRRTLVGANIVKKRAPQRPAQVRLSGRRRAARPDRRDRGRRDRTRPRPAPRDRRVRAGLGGRRGEDRVALDGVAPTARTRLAADRVGGVRDWRRVSRRTHPPDDVRGVR